MIINTKEIPLEMSKLTVKKSSILTFKTSTLALAEITLCMILILFFENKLIKRTFELKRLN